MAQVTILGTDKIYESRPDLNTMFTELYLIRTEVINARDGLANLLAQIDKLQADIATLTSSSACPVSLNDASPGYLNGKMTSSGFIGLTEENNGGDENLDITISDAMGWI